MTIMREYAHRYDDSIGALLSLNTLRNEYQKKIDKLNKLKKENIENNNEYYVKKIVRNRKISELESELFCGRI